MPLSAGSRLGPYEILAPLGAGGMGEVWRARDSRLNREVAIKVLPESFASDRDRLARFTREAQVLASLNHPNIAAIYGIEDQAIVMELVEGQDLKGPVPLPAALEYAAQIAAALEAAHDKGITHRDLKPANIKITPQGAVKVLDFGLAKIADSAASRDSSYTNSPTLTIQASHAGLILGTAAYMAPEQARGQSVDKRADIWAFGVVLWEMLSGRQLFEGDNVSDILAGVLKHEPDLSAFPAVRPLLAACLEKDPRKRLRDIGDWRRLLVTQDPLPSAPSRRPVWIAVALAAVAAIVAVWALARPHTSPPDAPLIELSAELGSGIVLGPRYPGHLFAVSPDGAVLAMTAAKSDSPAGMALAVRDLRTQSVKFLTGTDGASDPFFSPDGSWVAFFADGMLRKVAVDGGSVIPLCDLPGSHGGVWTTDGQIVVSSLSGPLLKLSSEGGKPSAFTQLAAGEALHRQPTWMPGSDLVLFASVSSPGALSNPVVHAVSLKTGSSKPLIPGAVWAREAPSGGVVFLKDPTLFASRLDSRSMSLQGPQVPVLPSVRTNSSWGGAISVSDRGTVVYALGVRTALSLFWEERNQPLKQYPFARGGYSTPELSPDGKRLAFRRTRENPGIWIADLERGTEFRLVPEPQAFAWTADGTHIIYKRSDPPELYRIRTDGGSRPEKLADNPDSAEPCSVSPDGKVLLLMVPPQNPVGGFDLYTAALSPNPPNQVLERRPFLDAGHTADGAVFSPDGRWIAYHSSEDGSPKVYVRPYPGPGPRIQVSRGWGRQPRWSRRRSELLYQGGDRRVMVVPYTVRGGAFTLGEPTPFGDVRVNDANGGHTFDLDPAGDRIILAAAAGHAGEGETHLVFLMNFFDELRRKLPPQ